MKPKAVLIGMPGSGKTRIGGEIATLLNVEFRDSDIEIEKQEGLKIPQIFKEQGEEEPMSSSGVCRGLMACFPWAAGRQ